MMEKSSPTWMATHWAVSQLSTGSFIGQRLSSHQVGHSKSPSPVSIYALKVGRGFCKYCKQISLSMWLFFTYSVSKASSGGRECFTSEETAVQPYWTLYSSIHSLVDTELALVSWLLWINQRWTWESQLVLTETKQCESISIRLLT